MIVPSNSFIKLYIFKYTKKIQYGITDHFYRNKNKNDYYLIKTIYDVFQY